GAVLYKKRGEFIMGVDNGSDEGAGSVRHCQVHIGATLEQDSCGFSIILSGGENQGRDTTPSSGLSTRGAPRLTENEFRPGRIFRRTRRLRALNRRRAALPGARLSAILRCP